MSTFNPRQYLTEAQRELGLYMALLACSEHDTTEEQVRELSDADLQVWLYQKVETYLVGKDWVETCVHCSGTGIFSAERFCETCLGDGFLVALDDLD